MENDTAPEQTPDRRQDDRRQAAVPFAGAERRQGPRRSGADRRTATRIKA